MRGWGRNFSGLVWISILFPNSGKFCLNSFENTFYAAWTISFFFFFFYAYNSGFDFSEFPVYLGNPSSHSSFILYSKGLFLSPFQSSNSDILLSPWLLHPPQNFNWADYILSLESRVGVLDHLPCFCWIPFPSQLPPSLFCSAVCFCVCEHT